MKPDLLIFDLDGTLIDSKLDLAISVNATLERFGRPHLPNETIYSHVGHGAAVLVRRVIGEDATESEVEEALRFFLQFYRTHALEHTKLYPGIQEAVIAIQNAGASLAVLTNKPVRISRDIIAALGLGECFFQIYGGDSFEEKKPNPVGILKLMEEKKATPQKTIMIGDSAVDIQTARNAGVLACGVTWGFHPDSLKEPAPDFLVDDASQLVGVTLADQGCQAADRL